MKIQNNIENFTKSAMVGLAVIGKSTMETVAFVLVGKYDFEIKCAFYFCQMKKNANKIEELEIPEVLEPMERLKSHYRKGIQEVFEHAAAMDKIELMTKLKDSTKPHAMGTVSEIAAKYNISKSEVRRRKLDGTLHELNDPALQ